MDTNFERQEGEKIYKERQVIKMNDNNISATPKSDMSGKDNKPLRQRDSKGRFLPGHKGLNRPKYDLMRERPKLTCENCFEGVKCPEYQLNSVCAHIKEFAKFDTREIGEVVKQFCSTTEESIDDFNIAIIEEIVSGELPLKLAAHINKNMKRIVKLHNLFWQTLNSITGGNYSSGNITNKILGNDLETPVENNKEAQAPSTGKSIFDELFGDISEDGEYKNDTVDDDMDYMGT